VLSLPFLADNSGQLISAIKNIFAKSWISILAVFSFLLIISIQLIIYKLSTGQFFIYSYKEEGFNFMNPQIWNFLFSYKKGMFVYTPLLLLSLVGFINMFRNNRYRFYSLLGFLFILIYVFSSWHMWYYGGSFSQRVMVEFYAFFSVLLATALQQFKSVNTKRVFLGLIVLLIVFCQIQTYQYRRMQIHWSDMNKEKYWEVFLRIDKL
jgi:putative copper export protein